MFSEASGARGRSEANGQNQCPSAVQPPYLTDSGSMSRTGAVSNLLGATERTSAAFTAPLPQHLSAFDLALMPDYRRNLRMRYMDNPPSPEEIEAAWLDWHKGVSGHQVYFVQRGHDPEGAIKIGTARRPARRIAELQTACDQTLVPLAVCKGGRAREQEYHRLFAAYRLSGEWFRPVPAIMQEIDRIRFLRGGGAGHA